MTGRLRGDERPVLIVGHGRSGTSWVGHILSTARGTRYHREPCHPEKRDIADFGIGSTLDVWQRYVRPGTRDAYLEAALDPAFRGAGQPRPIVKEVASVFSLRWIMDRYDPIVIVIVRNPIPTVMSALRIGVDPEAARASLLGRSALFEDHLAPYRAIIRDARGACATQAAIWAARHVVLADVLEGSQGPILVRYEDLCADPEAGFRTLFQAAGLAWTEASRDEIRKTTTEELPGPYATSRLSRRNAEAWRQTTAREDVRAIAKTVASFRHPFLDRLLPPEWQGAAGA